MPSPILHAATGVGIACLDRRAMDRLKWRFFVPVVAAAILPDFDVIPGLLVGDPNRFHSSWSHSLIGAGIAGILAATIAKTMRIRMLIWVFAAWTSHCLLDCMTPDGREPYGIPLLWPLSSHTYQTPRPILSGFQHGTEGASIEAFLAEVFSMVNLRVMIQEVCLGSLMVLLCFCMGYWFHRRTGHSNQPRKPRASDTI